MIFSELYSVYYNTVAKIMEAAFNPEATEKDLQRCVTEEAFSESVLTILPALKSGKWPLLHEDLSPVLLHKPTMPLTNLEKRWLKAIAEDPRVKLFGAKFPELDDVEPLFTRDDYKIYDQYSDGDPFEDEAYIEHFRLMLSAIRSDRPVQMTMVNRHGMELKAELPFCPLRRSSKYATAFPRRIFRRSGGIRLFFMGSCFPSLASLWTVLIPGCLAIWPSA